MEQSPAIGRRPRAVLRGGPVAFRLTPLEGIALLAALAGAFVAAYLLYAKFTNLNAKPAAAPTYIPAFRSTLTSTVSTTGSVTDTQQATLNFPTAGKVTGVFVNLGDHVTAGQPLAQLDDTLLRPAADNAQAQLNAAQQKLNVTLGAPQPADVSAAQQSIASAQAQLSTAQSNLTTLQESPTVSDLSTARQAVLTAQNQVQSAQDALTKAQNQVNTDQNAVTKATSDLNTAQTNLSQAQSDLSNAQLTLNNSYTLLQNSWQTLHIDCGSVPSPPVQGTPGTAITFDSSCNKNAGYSSALSGYNGAVTSYNSALSAVGQKQTAVTSASGAVTTAQTGLANAQQTLETDTNTLKNGSLQRAIQDAKVGVQGAQDKYNTVAAGPTQEQMDAAQKAVDSANASLASAQAKYGALFQPPTADVVASLQASVAQAQSALATAQKNLNDATLTAPFDGEISQIGVQPNNYVSGSTAVFVLLNPNLIRVDASVDQSDLSNMKAGQQATVTFDALPGRTYNATLTNIGLTPTVSSGVVTYQVSFGIDTSRLPQGASVPTPGMTGSITVITSQTNNALVVPSRAVRRVGRTQQVTVLVNGVEQTKDVTTGATNGTLTQIVSGLNDGDQVLVSSAATASSTAPASRTPNPNQFLPGGGGGVFVRPGGG